MTVDCKICADACELSTYFVNDVFVALTDQTPWLEFCFVLLSL
jgi:hypothetical protein